jgi:hypothetical protein
LFVGGPNNGKTGGQIDPAVTFPNPDELTVNGLASPVTPIYPVAAYSHEDGDAISSGFVYRGKLLPVLYGKFIFGDVTTGRMLCCNIEEMIAADDGDRNTMAPIHELQMVHEGQKRRMFDVIADQYEAKGGATVNGNALPGSATVTDGDDTDDIRIAQDGDGEIYILSKSDGMIRKMTAALIPPTITSALVTNNMLTFSWPAISNATYRVLYKDSITDTDWTKLGEDVTATGPVASKTDSATVAGRFYRLMMVE